VWETFGRLHVVEERNAHKTLVGKPITGKDGWIILK
jgi:hypothetical protein